MKIIYGKTIIEKIVEAVLLSKNPIEKFILTRPEYVEFIRLHRPPEVACRFSFLGIPIEVEG